MRKIFLVAVLTVVGLAVLFGSSPAIAGTDRAQGTNENPGNSRYAREVVQADGWNLRGLIPSLQDWFKGILGTRRAQGRSDRGGEPTQDSPEIREAGVGGCWGVGGCRGWL